MKPMGNARQHYWRTLKMAKAVGVPLATALRDGRLSESAYAQMITNCRRCPQPGRCEAMLESGQIGDSPPEFCCNAEILLALQKS